MKRWSALLILGGALTVGACAGDARSVAGPAAPSATVMAVSISDIAPDASSFQLTATAHLSNGTTQDVTREAAWQSSDARIANVSPTGLVTALANGDVDFRATYQGVTGAAHVTMKIVAIAVLGGVVTDATGGTPIASARVQLVGAGHVFTDERGAFSFARIGTGRVLVEITKDGYQPFEREVAVDHDVQLAIALSRSAP